MLEREPAITAHSLLTADECFSESEVPGGCLVGGGQVDRGGCWVGGTLSVLQRDHSEEHSQLSTGLNENASLPNPKWKLCAYWSGVCVWGGGGGDCCPPPSDLTLLIQCWVQLEACRCVCVHPWSRSGQVMVRVTGPGKLRSL